MNGIAFPDISPVAFSLMGLDIRWYSLAYLTGFIIGWFYILKLIKDQNNTFRPHKNDIDDFLPIAVLGVILGGRLGYVLFYQPAYFLAHPLEILQVWNGGMSFHGGALGVIVAMFIFAKMRSFAFLRLADLVTAAVPIGLFFGRLANFANGELYGRITDWAYGVRFPMGGYEPRHPSQLYEAFLEGLVLFIILNIIYRKTKTPGITASCFVMLYGTFRFIVEYFREPDENYGLILGHFSMGQMLSLPMVIIGLGLMLWFIYRGKKGAL